MKKNHAIITSLTALSIFLGCAMLGIANDATSPLTKTQQSAAKRGNNYAGSGRAEKAQTSYQTAIDQAVSIEQCLALVKSTERFGSIMSPVRRNCLTKALSLAKTDDDYFQIIIAARQCQFYEITKQCIDALIARAKTKDELLALAHKSQSMANNDVAHIAMEKLYAQIQSGQYDVVAEQSAARSRAPRNGENAEEARGPSPTERSSMRFAFAKQAKLMAMEDLMRKAIKDMLDQEQTTHGLCIMCVAVDPLEVPDLQRKILRKAVYQVTNLDDCHDIYETARRYGQQDIVDLAGFKGRKMKLQVDAHAEQEAVQEQAKAAQEEAQMNEEEKQEYETKKAIETQNKAQENQGTAKPKQPAGPGF